MSPQKRYQAPKRRLTRFPWTLRKTKRFATAAAIAGSVGLALTLSSIHVGAQATPEFFPGKNVDVVGPYTMVPYSPTGSNPFFLGDPDKKQQNEPSCDISPNNPLVIFCGMNDYRAVDRPDVSGDRWIGAAFSTDGGGSWKSILHPGFKPQAGPAPLVTPIGYDVAADPVVRLAPGIGLYSFIGFSSSGVGALLLGRWNERSIEGGFPYGFVDWKEIAKGTGSPGQSGRFLDKPAMNVSPLPGGTPYNFVVPDPTPEEPNRTRIQKVPAGIVHMAYAVFTGNDQQDGTKIMYARSLTYGETVEPAAGLSEAQTINQGVDIASDPVSQKVVVVWRRFADPQGKQTEAIMSAVSSDNGRSFAKASVVANICPFNQATTSNTFRVTTHPAVTFDGKTFHVVWADRGRVGNTCDPTGYSQIQMADLKSNGQWQQSASVAPAIGHQYLPTIISAGPRVLVAWFDTRRDEVNLDPARKAFVQDYLFDNNTKVRRRAADIWAAEAAGSSSEGGALTFGSPKMVSRYLKGIHPSDPARGEIELERNNQNNRMFSQGKSPFNGDYIASAATRWVVGDPLNAPGVWRSSAGLSTASSRFHLAWADNRLVRGKTGLTQDDTLGSAYTPPPVLTSESEPDPSTPRTVACVPAKVGSRDQSVFAAPIYPGLLIGSASTSKSTLTSAGSIQRSYTVFVQNPSGTPVRITMDLTKASTAATVVVSFAPLAVVTHLPRPTDDPSDFITIPARSGVARTVYVTSDASSPRPVVKVDATPEGGAGAVTTYINANPDAAPVEDIPDPQDRIDPNVPDTSIGSGETYTPTIDYRSISVSTPSLDEPSLDEPSLDEPSLDEPSLDEPSLDEPSLDEVAMAEPSLDEPSLDEPSLDEAAIPNAPISGSDTTDPDAESGFNTQNTKLTQITWKITMSGNTTTSMSTKIFVPNQTVLDALNGATNKQLIIWRRYRTSDVQKSSSGDCTPVRISNFQVIANVPNPTVTNSNTPPDPVNPKYSEPSATIPPGGSIFLTLRVWGDVPGFSPGKVGAAVQSQPNAVVQSTPDEDELLPPNRAPVATNTTAQVNEDTATAIQLTATDPDFDGLTFTTSAPANGTLSTPVGGTVTYTPNPNFFGTDTFTFQAIDVDGLPSNTATVTVTVAPVNDNPVGVTDTVSVAEDSGANAINVLGNDTDADNVLPVQPNTGLSVTAVGSASNGTTALVGGVVQYTPALNYNGPDTFTYTLSDGNGGSAVGTVNVTVTAANDPPVAGPDTKNAVLNAPVTFPATDLLVNDSPGPANEAGQSLSVTAVSNAFNGTVTLSGGQITFTATSSAGGSFNYTVRDSLGAEATGTVTVTVVPSYDFVAVSFPPSGNQGSVIPLVWQYKLNGVAVNTGSLVPVLRIRALTNCTPQATETGEFTENRQTPGNSDFQYSTSTFQWKFNWQTKPFPMGCYNVYIRLLASDGVTIIQDNGPMRIQLRK